MADRQVRKIAFPSLSSQSWITPFSTSASAPDGTGAPVRIRHAVPGASRGAAPPADPRAVSNPLAFIVPEVQEVETETAGVY